MPEQVALTLSEELTAALTRQARAQGLTLNSVVQAAWAILLGRLTGRDDVVFGVTVAGRPPEIAGIETMVGLFINTLPLRVELPPGKPLVALIRDLQERQSRLMAHQHLGLAEIQTLAGLGELFDTLTVFENYPVDDLAAEAQATTEGMTRLRRCRHHRPRRHALSAEPAGGAGRAAAAAARLSRRPVRRARPSRRLAQRLERLLTAAADDPDRAIGRLDILSADERRTILTDLERHRARRPGRHHPGSCSPNRPAARPTPPRWCSTTPR